MDRNDGKQQKDKDRTGAFQFGKVSLKQLSIKKRCLDRQGKHH